MVAVQQMAMALPAPPPSGVTGDEATVFLDTFTAANGTDPTSRDADVYPAITGAHRWQFLAGAPYTPGEIQSNKLVLTSGGADDLAVDLRGDGEEVLVPDFPYFAMIVGDPGDTSIRFDLYDDAIEYVEFYLGAGGVLQAYVGGFSGASWAVNPGDVSALGAGTHKVGVYVDADGASLIADGAVIASSPGTLGSTTSMQFCGVIVLAGSGQAVDSVAIYAGYSLIGATALTA